MHVPANILALKQSIVSMTAKEKNYAAFPIFNLKDAYY